MPFPRPSTPGALFPPSLIVLLAVCVPLRAEVRVKPAQATLAAGGACHFRVNGHPDSADVWRWTLRSGPGAIDPVTGLYRVSGPGVAATARVRVTAVGDPRLWGEASVVVLPHLAAPVDLVTQVLGGDWVEPYSRDVPFLDLATGERFTPDRVFIRPPWPEGVVQAAYGIPFNLVWPSRSSTGRRLLSYREGDSVVRLDVTGQTSHAVTFRGPVTGCTVETLEPLPRIRNAWTSHLQHFKVAVLGLVPLAGNPVAEPGHQDGRGGAARFRQPFGLASAGDRVGRQGLLVTDRESHVVRFVTAQGEVSTLCGQPGEAGHRDSPSLSGRLEAWLTSRPPRPALLNGPTHVAVRSCRHALCPQGWTACISDSGNHVIRVLEHDGRITTLAGSPGQAGYRDSSNPAAAAFTDPQGIAVARSGRVYVADRGNRLIRMIEPGGQVSTLAGDPGATASRDGDGLEAGFTDLKGLGLDVTEQVLYVLDGHAVRRIALPGGQVTTLLGVAGTPGFQDIPESSLETQLAAARLPCLNDPTGLLCSPGHLYIADRGNRALRVYDFRKTLRTFMGGPGPAAGTRWGLPRDTLEGPLDEGCGTLEAPCALAWSMDPPNDGLLVSSGRCLAQCHFLWDGQDTLAVRQLEVGAPGPGSPPSLGFGLETRDPFGYPTSRAVQYTVDCLDLEGDSLARIQGWATGWETVRIPLDGAEGADKLAIRCITDQGIMWRTWMPLRPPDR